MGLSWIYSSILLSDHLYEGILEIVSYNARLSRQSDSTAFHPSVLIFLTLPCRTTCLLAFENDLMATYVERLREALQLVNNSH
jgi:hypothetical protein